jgi:hypothetical protein
MKAVLLVAAAGAATVLAGCAAAPQTAWGKANVSKVDYGTDIGMCTGFAAMQGSGNQSKTAGGTDGAQTASRPPEQSGAGAPAPDVPGGTSSSSNPGAIGANLPTGSGMYQNNTSPDVVQRAANQEQARIMAAKRAKADAFKSCITQRGYTEFTLTPEQQQKLATFKHGSNEYHEYLYSLGADPSVVQAQGGRKQ